MKNVTVIYLLYSIFLGREIAGTVTLKQIYEIASIKKQDSVFNNSTLEGVCKRLIGSCRSCGIKVVSGRDEQQSS